MDTGPKCGVIAPNLRRTNEEQDMNKVKLAIAAGAVAVAMLGATTQANAQPYYYYGYGAYVPGYYGYYYPYTYAPVVEYYAPRGCWGAGPWGGYWGGC
jgi:hypothetical protein